MQSVNFIQEVGTGEGLRYPRYGNAPNAELVQRRVAALEGAEAAVLLGSGMGATACALLALLRPGDHLIASSRIYGGAHALLSKEFVGARHSRHVRRSHRDRAPGERSCERKLARSFSKRR